MSTIVESAIMMSIVSWPKFNLILETPLSSFIPTTKVVVCVIVRFIIKYTVTFAHSNCLAK
ncbi:ORF39 [Spodoptera exigua multiple nucleopolyhedrovirus]|uniref:Uncharacterized protein n=2 Tax=Spodoptera exigua multiple nucleopolyhedrovirus TaxID=10454 RepID=A0A6N0CAU1_9ABAC|nr:ORF39 [Spodoptera exigua multiple nucleopolyhedrovirus]AAF33569.1 ORF39 [Spodoptera exigua multiple nucleopolyhedrovirus]QKO28916.1 hypothetical protein [Spodoptera exigua multiple nucleopolyhedrovirus]